MTEIERTTSRGVLFSVLGLFGFALVACGMIIALVLFLGVMDIYNEPEKSRVYVDAMEFLDAKSGTIIKDEQGNEKSIELPKEARLILFYFCAGIFVLALASLLHAFLGSGLKLLSFTMKNE